MTTPGYRTGPEERAANAGARRATILVNPRARGVGRRFRAEAALRRLARHGIEARVEHPASPEAAVAAARRAADRGEPLVFVTGGDGSVRVIAGALAGTETAVASLPAGTANVFAHEAGIPGELALALDAHATGQTIPVDMGWAGDEPFLLMASAGWDAAIVQAVGTGRLKRVLGPAAYAVEAFHQVRGMRPRPIAWSLDGGPERTDDLLFLMASNTRRYGGFVPLTPDATYVDGVLDIVGVAPHTPLDAARVALAMVRGRLGRDPAAQLTRARELRIATAGLPVQVDGDGLGTTPVTFRIEPRALLMSVPRGPLPPGLRPRTEQLD